MATSLPVVSITSREPNAAPESILRIALAVVEEVMDREATVMPVPTVAVVVP
jgi:hypothetical protein